MSARCFCLSLTSMLTSVRPSSPSARTTEAAACPSWRERVYRQRSWPQQCQPARRCSSTIDCGIAGCPTDKPMPIATCSTPWWPSRGGGTIAITCTPTQSSLLLRQRKRKRRARAFAIPAILRRKRRTPGRTRVWPGQDGHAVVCLKPRCIAEQSGRSNDRHCSSMHVAESTGSYTYKPRV